MPARPFLLLRGGPVGPAFRQGTAQEAAKAGSGSSAARSREGDEDGHNVGGMFSVGPQQDVQPFLFLQFQVVVLDILDLLGLVLLNLVSLGGAATFAVPLEGVGEDNVLFLVDGGLELNHQNVTIYLFLGREGKIGIGKTLHFDRGTQKMLILFPAIGVDDAYNSHFRFEVSFSFPAMIAIVTLSRLITVGKGVERAGISARPGIHLVVSFFCMHRHHIEGEAVVGSLNVGNIGHPAIVEPVIHVMDGCGTSLDILPHQHPAFAFCIGRGLCGEEKDGEKDACSSLLTAAAPEDPSGDEKRQADGPAPDGSDGAQRHSDKEARHEAREHAGAQFFPQPAAFAAGGEDQCSGADYAHHTVLPGLGEVEDGIHQQAQARALEERGDGRFPTLERRDERFKAIRKAGERVSFLDDRRHEGADAGGKHHLPQEAAHGAQDAAVEAALGEGEEVEDLHRQVLRNLRLHDAQHDPQDRQDGGNRIFFD